MAAQAFPLTWPEGWPRILEYNRKDSRFNKTDRNATTAWRQSKGLTVSDGVERILTELGRMGVDKQDVIISTNVRTRLDGLPRSGEAEPKDPGAAIYWQHSPGSAMRCMAIDRYTTCADNLAAIAATLEAMRAIERHGGAEILDRAFTGFKALAAENAGESWWKTLQISPEATILEIERAYKTFAKLAHPDVPGGSDVAMRELNVARDQAVASALSRK